MKQAGSRFDPLARMRGVFYGWWLVSIAALIIAVGTVPLFYALGIWAVVLEHDFHWTRTQLFIAFALTRVEGSIMGPIGGYLTDRVGSRRMVLIGMSIMGAGLLFFSTTQNLWMFYLAFLLMAAGQGVGSWMPLMTAVNHWFSRQRATAMAWSELGHRIGGLVLIPIIVWALDPEEDRLGWRVVVVAIGVAVLLIALPLARLIRNRPEEYGQHPDGDLPAPNRSDVSTREAEPSAEPGADFTPRQALKTPAFWLITFGHAFTTMLLVTVVGHVALMLTDGGLSLQTAGWVMATYGGTSTVFQVCGGYIGDRVSKNLTIFVFASIMAGAVVVVTQSDSAPVAFLFAVLFGIGMGGRAPNTIAIRGDYFGRKAFARIMGLSQVPMSLCVLAAPLLTAVYYDAKGSYVLPFNILAGFCFVGGVLFLVAKKPVISTIAKGV